ncbi:unnamed protein product [Linum tenue]|uniref:Uncharacterized protein n=1 Tax=Linum tenue TaxID=586396 RepID=A0AAV0MUM2_9ROSI|nr:unnamed protein product [Linum tenue]
MTASLEGVRLRCFWMQQRKVTQRKMHRPTSA